jgi:hypothetical protein
LDWRSFAMHIGGDVSCAIGFILYLKLEGGGTESTTGGFFP